MATNCSCKAQITRSVSVLGLRHIYQEEEKPDRVEFQNVMKKMILNNFSENNFILVRPIGNCEILKTSSFLARRRIPKKNRTILNARKKHWILNELRTLKAFEDIIDHVNEYPGDSPEMTLISHALFYGSQFESGRLLLEALIQFIDLRDGSNQIIESIYDQGFRQENSVQMLQWAAILNAQARQASNAALRANLLADYVIHLGKSDPSLQPVVEKMIRQNCWNIFNQVN